MIKTDKSTSPRIVLHSGAWTTNIGNAFIHLGAIALIEAAAPNVSLTLASGMPRWFFNNSALPTNVKRFPRRAIVWESVPESIVDNAIDMTGVTECDFLVITGMTLCEEFVHTSGPPLRAASSAGTKTIFLGAGAQDYSEHERHVVTDFLREIRPMAFVSRDPASFEMFHEAFEHSMSGIDCAFAVPDTHSPHRLRLPPYRVATFDSSSEPKIELDGHMLIRAHHNCWGPIPFNYCVNPNTLVSDMPYDYLALYANAEEVHADRVHACIAALAYGRKARFYFDTPRASLFEALGAEQIRNQLVFLDQDLLTAKKQVQIEFLRNCLLDPSGSVGNVQNYERATV